MKTMMDFHPLAAAYPLMEGAEFEALAGRMAEAGFDRRFPIVRYEGKVLDGRNRCRAAAENDIDPFYVDFTGTAEEAAQFVIDANEHRRHLTPQLLAQVREQRRARVAAARAEGQSTRAIAQAEGVSKTTVLNDLDSSGGQGCPPEQPDDTEGTCDDEPETPPRPAPALCLRCQRVGTASCAACRAKGAKAAPVNGKANGKVHGKDGKSYPASKPKQKRQLKPWTFKDCRKRMDAVTRDIDHLVRECTERAAANDARFRGFKTAITAALGEWEKVYGAVERVGKAVEAKP